MTDRHTVLSNGAIPVIRALDSYGISGRDVLQEAGIDYEFIRDPDSRLSNRQWQAFLRLAVKRSGDPCFGITCAEMMQPAVLNGLGLAWLVSETIGDALRRLVRYQRILSSIATAGLEETDTHYELWGRYQSTKDDRPLSTDHAMFMGSVVKLYRLTVGPHVNPESANFECGKPVCAQRYEEFFRCPVTFNAQRTALFFNKKDLDSLLPTYNPEFSRLSDEAVIEYLARFDKDDVVTRTRQQIIEHLPAGRPTQQEIARDLNMSVRSFHRRLKDEGLVYSDLVDEVRRELAAEYLNEQRFSIGEIGFMLGFTEPSNFARFFKKWEGKTPTEYRSETL